MITFRIKRNYIIIYDDIYVVIFGCTMNHFRSNRHNVFASFIMRTIKKRGGEVFPPFSQS